MAWKVAWRIGIAVCVLVLMAGCGRSSSVAEIDTTEWRSGDVIFRCGNGMESKVVVSYSGGTYSHVGLLYEKDGRWYVLHAVPKENEKGAPEWLKCEDVVVFLSPDRAREAAWGRIRCSDSVAQSAAQYALQKVEQNLVFDNDYQLTDTLAYYCTELVWQSYLHYGVDIASLRGRIEVPVVSRDSICIFPNDIEEDDDMEFVRIISFNH